MSWPFSKRYRVRCPNGHTKTVYRNIDDAFPLCIPGWKANLSVAGKAIDEITADIKGEYATAIHGLLFALDDLNQGLMMTFRAAYVVYQNDPCLHGDFFAREVAKLLDEQGRLRALKVQIDGLIEIARLQPQNSGDFARLLASIVDRMSFLILPEATADRVEEAKRIARKMTEVENEG